MKKAINPDPSTWSTLLERPMASTQEMDALMLDVFEAVRLNGDQAVRDYTQRFDGVLVDQLQVTAQEIEQAKAQVADELKEAISLAKTNIEKFHRAQQTNRVDVETQPGVQCWQEKRPIQKVGLYIPGGTAPLFSTILMLAIPATIAGCQEIVLCSPPNTAGTIHPAILYTAQLCGVDTIIKAGGVQAIAAMTLGTKSVPQVYKLFGPGNQYVTAAKQYATKLGVSIDMPAGPSELLVMADDSADAAFVASDLLSQAEHGADSQVVLVSTSKTLLSKVEDEMTSQLDALSRKQIAQQAIANSVLIYLPTKELAAALINAYGPEHYILCVEEEDYFLGQIANAGSVFVGNYTPESAGDYASGTNHTLPTNGYAKQYSGVNLDSFLKSMTFQRITAQGIQNIGPAIELMAAAEGLDAHKNAVTLRLNALNNE
ncbi:histidinol dehydrogenase [Croceiramulus getboli]|nr:histidinol dehydrogenase [Flavobacteriaceae bacterium YJPT1-3]